MSEATVEAHDPGLCNGRGIRLIEAVEDVAMRLGAIDESLASAPDVALRSQIAVELLQFDDALHDALDQLARRAEDGEGSHDPTDLQALATAGAALDQQLAAMRAAHTLQQFPPAQSVVLLAFAERCKELGEAVQGVAAVLAPDRGGA